MEKDRKKTRRDIFFWAKRKEFLFDLYHDSITVFLLFKGGLAILCHCHTAPYRFFKAIPILYAKFNLYYSSHMQKCG